MGPVPLGGDLKERKGSCIQGNHLTGREIIWDRRGGLGAQKRGQQPVCGRQGKVRSTQMVCATAPCVPA